MRIDVLGPLQASDGDRLLEIGPPQHRLVLAALVIDADHVVDVDVLVNRVWGEDAADTATPALHACISRLRKRLGTADRPGEKLIITRSPGYRLAVSREDVDATRFADLISAARRSAAQSEVVRARELVGEALALWRGTPYGGVRADFVEYETTRLLDQRGAALELAADLDLRLGRHAELVDTLRDAVETYPLREGLRGSLMTALYRAGRQSEALLLYDETRRLLDDELGIDPGADLQRLHQLMLRQDPALDPPRPAAVTVPTPQTGSGRVPDPAPPASRGDEAMVGRAEQLEQGLGLLRRALRGESATAVIIGEAGIGKTRLSEELARHAAAAGAVVAWGRCYDYLGGPSSWPWAQALTSLIADLNPGQVAALLAGRGEPAAVLLPPGTAPSTPPASEAVSPDVARFRLFDAVVAVLRALARDRPVCIVLEDLHWADAELTKLTEYVCGNLRGSPVLLVVTVRSPSEDPDRTGAPVLAALTQQPTAERIVLTGLERADVRAYATSRLGREVDEATAERLRRRTDGNPFYISELVRLLVDERQAAGRATGTVPTSIRAVIERRLRYLEPATREVLTAAAVIGRTFDVRLLGEVSGRSLPELAAGLDRAAAAGVLEPVAAPTGEWTFAHALVPDTFAAAAGPMARAVLHAQIAEVLEARHADDLAEVAALLAHHQVAAAGVGDPVKAVRFCLLAADRALRRWAFAEAERHLHQALEVVPGVPGAAAARLELEARVQLGSLLTLRDGYNATSVAEQRTLALDLAARTGSTAELLSALWGAWGNALVSGDFPKADRFADQLLRAASRTADPMLLLAGHHARGQVRYHQGRLAEARADLEIASRLADEHAEQVRLEIFIQHPAVSAPGWLATVLTLLGEIEAADEVGRLAESRADELSHAYTSSYLDILEGWRAVFLLRTEQALTRGERAVIAATERGFQQLVAFALPPRGWGRATHGRGDEGAADLRLAIDIFTSLPAGHMFGHVMLAALADALLWMDRAQDALSTVEAAIAESERTGERFFLAPAHLIRAEALRRLNRPPADVAQAVGEASAIAEEQGAQLFAARAAAYAA